jgi:hypothetical protein
MIDKKIRKSYAVGLPKQSSAKKVSSTVIFPDDSFRLNLSNLYIDLGYRTMNSYLLDLIKLSMEDDYIKNKLKK